MTTSWRNTTVVFAILALCFWINAAVNRFLFNVAIAVVGSVPLAIVVAYGVAAARRDRRAARLTA